MLCHLLQNFALLTRLMAIAVLSFTILDTSPAKGESPAALEPVTIAQFGKERFLLYLPLYIAIEEGYFEKRGIKVKLQFAGNDDQVFASVMRGDALFGIGDPAFAAIAREKGGSGKVIALLVKKLGLSGVSKPGSLPYVISPDLLKGLRISSFPSPSTTFTLLSKVLREHKLLSIGTRIAQTAIGTQIAALEAGLVDIALDLEPAISIAESKGFEVSFLLDTFTESQAITGLTTLDSTISEKPDLVRRVVASIHEALGSIQREPDIARRVAITLYPTVSPEIIERAVARMLRLGVFPSSSLVPDSLWQTTLKTRLEAGDLTKSQPTGFTVDNSFAENAAQQEATK